MQVVKKPLYIEKDEGADMSSFDVCLDRVGETHGRVNNGVVIS